MNQGNGVQAVPSHEDLERAIRSVPGVAEATVGRAEDTGRGRLRIRLHPGEDPERVSWSVAATLRERFGIALDPEEIRPRLRPAEGPDAVTAAGAEAVAGHDGAASLADFRAARAAGDDRVPDGGGAEALEPGPLQGPGQASGSIPEDDPPTRRDEEPPDAVANESGGPADPDDEGLLIDTSSVTGGPASTPQPRDVLPAGTGGRAWRPAIRDLGSRNDGAVITVTASLELDGRIASGEARGAPTTRGLHRAIAEATVGAMGQLTHTPLRAQVDRVTVAEADPAAVTVIVSLLSGRGEELLLGGSIVRGDIEHAIMRAALDALNRRLQPDLVVES